MCQQIKLCGLALILVVGASVPASSESQDANDVSFLQTAITTEQTSTFYVSESGSDTTGDGSESSPFGTIQQCVDQIAALGAGTKCIIRGGTYKPSGIKVYETHCTVDEPCSIESYPGETVTIDGTVDVSGGWTYDENACPNAGGCWYKDVDVKPWALFVNGEMQTNARWPNALIDDWSVFDTTRWAACSSSTTYVGPKSYGDSAAECMVDDHTIGCSSSSYNSDDYHFCHPDADATSLKASNLDATGATVIVNNGHWLSYASTVTAHTPGQSNFTYQSADGWKVGKFIPEEDIYYLENKLEFLDLATEWFFDTTLNRLYLKTKDNASPNDMTISGRTQDYAMFLLGVTNLKIKGLNFFATGLFGDFKGTKSILQNLTLDTVSFKYAGGMKTMLGDTANGIPITITPGNDKTISYGITIFNSSFYGIDNDVLQATRSGWTVSNCLFEYIDWTTCSFAKPTGFDYDTLETVFGTGYWYSVTFQLDHADIVYPNVVERCTFEHNGESEGVQTGRNGIARLNRFAHKYALQNDGAAFQTGGMYPWYEGEITWSHNWIYDTVDKRNSKWALRIDRVQEECTGSEDETLNSGTWGFRATLDSNVCFYTSGISVKGNDHTVTNNLVLWSQSIGGDDQETGTGHGGANIYNYITGICGCDTDSCKLQNATCCVEGDDGTFEGIGNTIVGNAFDQADGVDVCASKNIPATTAMDSFIGPDGSMPGASNNAAGSIIENLRDPRNQDFRPKIGSVYNHLCIGPYGAITHGGEYFIGGRQEWTASYPIPPDGSTSVKADADLMFQPALGATSHQVYIGLGGASSLTLQGTLEQAAGEFKTFTGMANVFTTSMITEGATVHWRVDGVDADGTVRTGPVWSFTVNSNVQYDEELAPWQTIGTPTSGTCSKLTADAASFEDGANINDDVSEIVIPAVKSKYKVSSINICVDAETVNSGLGDWQFRTVFKANGENYFKRLKNNKRGGTATQMIASCYPSDASGLSQMEKDGGEEPFTGSYEPFDPDLLTGFSDTWGKSATTVTMRIKDHTAGTGSSGTISFSVEVCFDTNADAAEDTWPAAVSKTDCPWYS